MLKYFIGIARRHYTKIKVKSHWNSILESCIIGDSFCTSPAYKDRGLQLLNVRVTNSTFDKTKIRFGSFCNVTVNIFLNSKGSITIGDYVYMNSVTMRIDHNLIIGSHCLFAANVRLWDTDNHPLSAKARHLQCEHIAHEGKIDSYLASGGDIIIGDDVWIGMDVIVLGGVMIGRGSVVAAGSVVTTSIPENVLAGGIPAKVIKSLE
jgi:acetyltransferase-like isoleucine patch superfamily enzyme